MLMHKSVRHFFPLASMISFFFKIAPTIINANKVP